MKPIGRILRYLRHFPGEIGLNVLFNLLHVLFNLGSYVLIVPFVELLFGLNSTPAAEPEFGLNQHQLVDWAFWHLNQYKETLGIWPCLFTVAGGYLACSLLSNLFRYLGMFFLATIRNGLIERLRNDIYHKVTILPVSYFNRKRRGDLISRMSNDLADIDWSVFSTMQSLVKDPINVLVFSATLLFVSWRLFVLFLIVLPLGVWLIARIGKSLKRNSQQGQNRLGRLFALLDESLTSLRAIKSFGREADREYSGGSDHHRKGAFFRGQPELCPLDGEGGSQARTFQPSLRDSGYSCAGLYSDSGWLAGYRWRYPALGIHLFRHCFRTPYTSDTGHSQSLQQPAEGFGLGSPIPRSARCR